MAKSMVGNPPNLELVLEHMTTLAEVLILNISLSVDIWFFGILSPLAGTFDND
jgi:hypothetical protein